MAQPELMATVKQVISGDTLVLVSVPRGGPPPEKQLTLSCIMAPRVAMKSLSKETPDEPYGWPAREFMRERLIGQQVTFTNDYTYNNRNYGTVRFNGENVAIALLREGFARLKSGNRNEVPDYDELLAAQQVAESEKKGQWTGDPGLATIRNITWATAEGGYWVKQFVEKHKGQRLPGIVEFVRDGAYVRMYLPKPSAYVSVMLSGILVDTFKRVEGEDKPVPEPFAVEARFFVEIRILNRLVDLRVEGCDDYGNIFGTIYHPKGNISLLLLRNGFAKIQEWSAKFVEEAGALREALKEAQQKRLRKWAKWQPSVSGAEKEYNARVVEVVSGDCVVVEMCDLAIPVERRLYIASIRCPRTGNRFREDEPWAFEAKEFVRKKLIGKKVKIVVEYMRDTSAVQGVTPPPASDESGKMHFVTVYYDNGRTSLSEQLLAQGLARALPHRSDDDRAENYHVYTDLEKKAQEEKKGIHAGDVGASKHRINDLLGAKNATRARSFEDSLKRLGKVEGVVEHVFNGARFKVRIPQEGIAVSFILGGLRCPQTAWSGQGQPPKEAEPFADDALHFSKDLLMQRNVSLKVDACDRGGNFLGTMWKDKDCVNALLLGQGFAKTVDYSLSQSPVRSELIIAEQSAREQRLGIWSLPGAVNEESVNVQPEQASDEIYDSVEVCHINTLTSFYIQDFPNPIVDDLQLKIQKHATVAPKVHELYTISTPPKKGDLILAPFSADNDMYRARVDSVDKSTEEVTVMFVDFGNSEVVKLRTIRICPAEFQVSAIPYQARHCMLSNLKPAPDHAEECAQHLQDVITGKVIHCVVTKVDNANKIRHVILTPKIEADTSQDDEDEENEKPVDAVTVNEMILREGLAILDWKNGSMASNAAFERMREAQNVAKKARKHVWIHGDIGESDDEDDDRAKPRRR